MAAGAIADVIPIGQLPSFDLWRPVASDRKGLASWSAPRVPPLSSVHVKPPTARLIVLPSRETFFEWKAIKGQKAKQPYAIAMKDGAPFGIAGIWENWKEPASGEWIRTFAIITTDANELVAEIHDRMPVILAPSDYARWLGEEPDPRGLMRQFPGDLMRMWPISNRVNKPKNDDPSIVEPIELVSSRV